MASAMTTLNRHRNAAEFIGSRVIQKGTDVVSGNMITDLQDNYEFKKKMKRVWKDSAGDDKELDEEEFQDFLGEVEREFDIPPAAFGNMADVFDMYDFNGDGTLQFNEGFKLVKHMMRQYLKKTGAAEPPAVEFKTPEEAGYGDVIKILGEGGQGTAKLVRTRAGRDRVLKVYDKNSANAAGIDDLQDEMEAMEAGNKNPHIARCYEIFQDSRSLYMVGDPYFGGDFASLQDKAEDDGVDLTESWYANIFKQAFTGLNYLHENAIVHSDIKEPNLMVKDSNFHDPDVVIIDLGLAGATLGGEERQCGTPGYMPPEVYERGAWFPRGDVFSMGVVVVQMLARRVPDHTKGVSGIFQDPNGNIEGCKMMTRTQEPPYGDMEHDDDSIMDWLPSCLEKNFEDRSKPAEILSEPFFNTGCAKLKRCTIS